ncbi:histidine kinase [Caulobacter endophyticus]|uniref:histidine kinase n=1 Tax=Caulobacter endophyticus TaxID=2172652 RepID=A0A2T9K9Q7_9CAUL|nr:histidine kinase [Caulobacter endophyticus]
MDCGVTEIADDIAAVASIEVVPRILQNVCRLTGMGYAVVARVTPDRWVACAVADHIDFGLPVGGELSVETTLCSEIRDHHQSVLISNVAEDAQYANHPTPAMYGLQSYIAVPIFCQGEFFGTLCAIDPAPAPLAERNAKETFELFAQLIGAQLEAGRRLAFSEAALTNERAGSELREQFIAVLGHDLRNPLAAVEGGVRLLRKDPTGPRSDWILSQMEASTTRMAGLISDVMDFARARLGGGFNVDLSLDGEVGPALLAVVSELWTAHPDRVIEANIIVPEAIPADRQRLAQLLSNLVANALTHGAKDSAVVVKAEISGPMFELSVANQGPPIPSGTLARLFQPFERASATPTQQGLGLGLYIASEIARAHKATLTATSTSEETRFTLRMPIGI